MASLDGRIAVVAGASRGAGRGIALALGEAGATVYAAARTLRGRSPVDGAAGSLEDTVAEIAERGGRGVAVRVDHGSVEEVEGLFARVRRDAGRLDVLANAVWGGNERFDGTGFEGVAWDAGFWLHPLGRWREMMGAGLEAAFLASYYAAPLLVERGAGLIATVSDGTEGEYHGNLYWDLAHAAIDRLVHDMAVDLRPYGVAAVGVLPGFMRTERVVHHLESKPELVEQYGRPVESTEYVGRAVAALAAAPDAMERSGRVLRVGELARAYGFTDVDGTRPQWPPS